MGLVLLLPFLGWTVTGLVFFVKPGYEGAFELLQPKTYPIEVTQTITTDPTWLEFRCLRTILGSHLLVRTSEGWLHLDPVTMRPKDKPSEDEVRSLVVDAFSTHPQRYGHITGISNSTVTTDTNIRIVLDWNRLSLQQRGTDTDRIDLLYRIHYLQWTGITVIDRILGPLGLALVLALSIMGVCLAKGSAKLK